MIRSSAHRRVIANVTGQEFVETTPVELQPGQVVATAPSPGESLIVVPESVVQQAQSLRDVIKQQLTIVDRSEEVKDYEELFKSFQGGEIPAGVTTLVGEHVCSLPHFCAIPDASGYSLDHTEDTDIVFGHDDGKEDPDFNEDVPVPRGLVGLLQDVHDQPFSRTPKPVAPVIDDGHAERTKQFTITAQEAERRARSLGIPSARAQQSSPTVLDKTQDILKAYELGLPYAAYVWLKMELKRIEDKVLTLG